VSPVARSGRPFRGPVGPSVDEVPEDSRWLELTKQIGWVSFDEQKWVEIYLSPSRPINKVSTVAILPAVSQVVLEVGSKSSKW
jgi:hypothetical protein